MYAIVVNLVAFWLPMFGPSPVFVTVAVALMPVFENSQESEVTSGYRKT